MTLGQVKRCPRSMITASRFPCKAPELPAPPAEPSAARIDAKLDRIAIFHAGCTEDDWGRTDCRGLGCCGELPTSVQLSGR